jgi:hypothetical protein
LRQQTPPKTIAKAFQMILKLSTKTTRTEPRLKEAVLLPIADG